MKNFLDLAIDEAYKYQFLTLPNPAVGALIERDGEIISCEAHKSSGNVHAEIEAIKTAFVKFTNKKIDITDSKELHQFFYKQDLSIFKNCNLYVTLEPCNHMGKTPPCSHLVSKCNFKEILIGAKEKGTIEGKGAKYIEDNSNSKITFIDSKKARDLLIPFEEYKKGKFIFFKQAMRSDTTINNGKISSDKTLKFIHSIRDKLDLLIISGKTIREDKPTLDARYVNGKASDILIYSKQKEFDNDISLFNIKNREIYISNTLDILQNKLKDKRYIMIEGGNELFSSMRQISGYYLLIIHDYANSNIIYDDFMELKGVKFEVLHTRDIALDKLFYLKVVKNIFLSK